METNRNEVQMMQSALDALVTNDHPRVHPDGVELWTGDNGKSLANVPDDDQRMVFTYEWNGNSWVSTGVEPYHS